MSTSHNVRAPRQAAILATIVGLHAGATMLLLDGVDPRLEWRKPPAPMQIFVRPPPPEPPPAAPRQPEPLDYGLPGEPEPLVPIPDFEPASTAQVASGVASVHATGSGPGLPGPDIRSPSIRMWEGRLAALIDACYPTTSRRLSEEGRVVVQLRIEASGRVAAWNMVERSGFARLDAAADCVIRRLEFVPGRRDGAAVEASVLLPIVFRLG